MLIKSLSKKMSLSIFFKDSTEPIVLNVKESEVRALEPQHKKHSPLLS